MTFENRRRDKYGNSDASGGARAISPGKRTLTSALSVQRKASTAAASTPANPATTALAIEPANSTVEGTAPPSSTDVHAAAERGTSGSGGALPYAERIQAAFGGHDVSNVQAYTGGTASEASTAMGAEAYATGNKVAFGGAPSLHTAAHEAAHVIQQRAGVSLSGGVGQLGDTYEQHADAVADAVVQGRSAEGLLDRHAGGGSSGVQRRSLQQHPRRESGTTPAPTATPTTQPAPTADPETQIRSQIAIVLDAVASFAQGARLDCEVPAVHFVRVALTHFCQRPRDHADDIDANHVPQYAVLLGHLQAAGSAKASADAFARAPSQATRTAAATALADLLRSLGMDNYGNAQFWMTLGSAPVSVPGGGTPGSGVGAPGSSRGTALSSTAATGSPAPSAADGESQATVVRDAIVSGITGTLQILEEARQEGIDVDATRTLGRVRTWMTNLHEAHTHWDQLRTAASAISHWQVARRARDAYLRDRSPANQQAYLRALGNLISGFGDALAHAPSPLDGYSPVLTSCNADFFTGMARRMSSVAGVDEMDRNAVVDERIFQ